jgi:hypothetical protein
MKKYIIVLGSSVLFLTLCFSGCEEFEEEDYITVNINAKINGYLMDKTGYSPDVIPNGIPLHISMVKAGGERLDFDKTSDQNGIYVTGSFNLYREQPIDIYAYANGNYSIYLPGPGVSATLTWETVDAAADFGETYTWSPTLYVTLVEPSL